MTRERWHTDSPPPGDTAASRSWALLRASGRLVASNRSLAAVALVAGLAQAASVATVFLLTTVMPGDSFGVRMTLAGLLAAWPLQVVGTGSGVMLVAAGDAALEGRSLPPHSAFRVALSRWRLILAWSLLAAGVGVLVHQVAERLPFGGQLLAWIADVAWGLATMFAVPILVLEPVGPKRVVERSAAVFRARWGEGLAGQLSVGFLVSIPMLIGGTIVAAGITAGGTAGGVALAVGATIAVAAIVAQVTAQSLYSLALFRFATSDETHVGPFSEAILRGGLKLKPARRR